MTFWNNISLFTFNKEYMAPTTLCLYASCNESGCVGLDL